MKKLILLLFFTFSIQGCGVLALFVPSIRVMVAEQDGKATLAEAESSKKVQVMEAEGKLTAATFLANAEIERAKGVAQANQIIGKSLKDNPDYLKWLYIEGLKERTGIETIYVPTEAGLPILEAGKRGREK